jgi:hypothetical protein
MNMKNLRFVRFLPLRLSVAVIALAAAGGSVVQSRAQTTPSTNAIPTGENSFFQTALGYFTSFNTNLDGTFGAHRGMVFTGVDSIQGASQTLANTIGVSYEVWKPSSAPATNSQPAPAFSSSTGGFGLALESVTRNGGVTGTIISQGAGIALDFDVHDVRVNGYVDGVYQFQGDKLGGEIGLRIFKALGANTFAGVGIGEQFPGNHQIFSAFVGFVF